jgi:hypothetical protein
MIIVQIVKDISCFWDRSIGSQILNQQESWEEDLSAAAWGDDDDDDDEQESKPDQIDFNIGVVPASSNLIIISRRSIDRQADNQGSVD